MANNFASNVTEKLLRKFLVGWNSDLVTLKTIDRQVITDADWDPTSGETIKVKRPHDYFTRRTAAGDISSGTNNSIQSGSSVATVQQYFTIKVDWTQKDEALFFDQPEKILKPIRKRMATDIETDFNGYMLKHGAHLVGTAGTAVTSWDHVSAVDAYTRSFGFPADDVYCQLGPYAIKSLASAQNGILNANLSGSSWEKASINMDFGGVMAYRSSSLVPHVVGAWDAGTTLNATPTATYVAVKDTFQMTLSIAGFDATTTGILKAGDMLQITDNDRFWLNQQTKNTMHDGTSPVKWTCVVTATVDSSAGGVAAPVVEGPAIFESNGQQNSVSSAITSGDAITVISGTADSTNYPNMFYHKQAFGIQFVELPPLQGWDSTVITIEDFSIRCTKYSDADTNVQKMRFDVLPAYVTYNPLLAGRFFGSA